MRFLAPLSLFVTLSAAVIGCAELARWTRQYTYPPDFRYIERDQLRSVMWQLAQHVREIDRHIQSPEQPAQHRKEILDHLAGMDAALAQLGNTGWPSNHPLVDMNLPKFRQDIRLAREAIERDPPNYLLTYSATGACVYCHPRR